MRYAKKIKSGDYVWFKDEATDTRRFRVYALYPNNELSLSIFRYPDTEGDRTYNINLFVKSKPKR